MLLAVSLPKEQLNDEQFNLLCALVECEYEKGKRFEEIAERFFMIYGKKAVSVDTLKTWYDALESNSLQSTRQNAQAPERAATLKPFSNYIDMQSSVRCVFIAGYWDIAFSPRFIDTRYVFYYKPRRLSHFYVMATFHGDVQ